MCYVQGVNRDQTLLLPEVIDEYVDDDNPVRFIDAYVDSLNLIELDFSYAETKETGRPPYNPGDMLKLYIYGYLNRVRSSRRLEKEAHRNLEVIWLLRKLRPDFKTIADFRKDNYESIKKVCRDFTLLCKKLNLFDRQLIAIDGSKFNQIQAVHISVDDDNPVRFIDAYVDSLNLIELDFSYAETKETGRPPYNPGDMLKLYIYGLC